MLRHDPELRGASAVDEFFWDTKMTRCCSANFTF